MVKKLLQKIPVISSLPKLRWYSTPRSQPATPSPQLHPVPWIRCCHSNSTSIHHVHLYTTRVLNDSQTLRGQCKLKKKSLYQIYVYSFLRQCVILVYFVWTELSRPLFFTSPSPCVVCKLTSQRNIHCLMLLEFFLAPTGHFFVQLLIVSRER